MFEDTHPDGTFPNSGLHQEELANQNYVKCMNPMCNHMFNPEVHEDSFNRGGSKALLRCSHCGHNQLAHARPGKGGTATGLGKNELGDIAENMIEAMGEIPNVGKILWWHQGGSSAQSPLDGMTLDWGIEVKAYGGRITLDPDPKKRERGIINAADKVKKAEAINDPALFARSLGDPNLIALVQKQKLKGLMGILVIFNFFESTAEVHAVPMISATYPEPMASTDVNHLVPKNGFIIADQVPFNNPLSDPTQPGWIPHYQQGQDDIGF